MASEIGCIFFCKVRRILISTKPLSGKLILLLFLISRLFSFQLKYNILPGLITVGKYDGSHSCLTAVTTGAKVLIHSPHRRNREISFLNVNETVTAICAGRLKPDEEKDILVIGSASNVLAYHVDDNSDLFYKEVPDGVRAITIGNLGKYDTPLLIIGGNCSIQGFDWKGQDIYWTVTGDNVRSLALVDINQDGLNELVVGSEDYEIRVFKDDLIIHEMTETEVVTSLISFKGNKFAYALANGTVGVYDKLHRLWRVKSKNMVQSLGSYDLDGNGIDELITGWSNGKLDTRNLKTGEIIFKDILSHGIAGIVAGDYRRAGRNQLIIVSEIGEVKGYDGTSLTQDTRIQTDIVRDLFSKKQVLLAELKNYDTLSLSTPGIPANTRLVTEISASVGNKGNANGHVLLNLSTNNLTLLRAITVFAEGIFEGETLVIHPSDASVSTILNVALYPPKDTPLDIHIRAFVGNDVKSEQFHVFELTRQLPKFSMYVLVPYSASDEPASFVSFQFNERAQRLDMWLRHHFLVPNIIPVKAEGDNNWRIAIKALRDDSFINIKYSYGTMMLITENIGLASEIIQSMASYLNIDNLECTAEFPLMFDNVGNLLSEISSLQQNASKISAMVADSAALVRSLTVQAEDSRILRHMKDMRECYTQLFQINEEMMRNHKVRCTNHEILLSVLRKINLIIQQAARLRVGKNKTELISQCRAAVADNNINVLIKLIRTGCN